MNRTLSSLFIVLVGAAACTDGRETFTDPSLPIEMRRGAEFDIALKSNQSTGYQWVLADSAALAPLRLVGKDYTIPRKNRGANGAGGTETWTFSAPEPGQATIHLVYKRPWEGKPPIESAMFRVRVR
ncbi:MAG TPA: protease inhibitor I42 family protein [Longimicrobium sp.]|nr:protease inhibitor I42 family protein [Longimicrobium sp.]